MRKNPNAILTDCKKESVNIFVIIMMVQEGRGLLIGRGRV